MPELNNIVYIGSEGILSEVPLQILLQHNCPVRAIALLSDTLTQIQQRPRRLGDIRVGASNTLSQTASLLEIAQQFEIPVLELPEDLSQAAGLFQQQAADLILMSCFPRKLPPAVFEFPEHGCYNLHPSLLPAYRGPSPVHWQCEHQLTQSGVTVHRVVEQLDQGEIAVQFEIEIARPATKVELAYQLAMLGGDAFVQLISQIEQGTLELKPQNHDVASYYGFPGT